MTVDHEELENQLLLEQQLFEEQAALLQATKASRVSNYILHLRQFSDFLLLAGYLTAATTVIAGAVPALTSYGSTGFQILVFLLAGLVATVLFVLLKFLSTLVEFMAEQQATLLSLKEQVTDLTHLIDQQSNS